MKKIKKLLFCLLSCALCGVFAFAAPSDSKRKAIAQKLYGRIMLVNAAPDYRVHVVNTAAAADLRVKIVKNRPASSPGEWQLVNAAPVDYRVEIVRGTPDLYVVFVDNNPGVQK